MCIVRRYYPAVCVQVHMRWLRGELVQQQQIARVHELRRVRMTRVHPPAGITSLDTQRSWALRMLCAQSTQASSAMGSQCSCGSGTKACSVQEAHELLAMLTSSEAPDSDQPHAPS